MDTQAGDEEEEVELEGAKAQVVELGVVRNQSIDSGVSSAGSSPTRRRPSAASAPRGSSGSADLDALGGSGTQLDSAGMK